MSYQNSCYLILVLSGLQRSMNGSGMGYGRRFFQELKSPSHSVFTHDLIIQIVIERRQLFDRIKIGIVFQPCDVAVTINRIIAFLSGGRTGRSHAGIRVRTGVRTHPEMKNSLGYEPKNRLGKKTCLNPSGGAWYGKGRLKSAINSRSMVSSPLRGTG